MPGSGPGTYGWVSGCATIGTGLGYTVLGSFANGGNFTGVTAIGLGARAGANFATAVGVESVATGEASSAYGTGSIASANNAISIGGGGAAKLGANLSTRATANGAIAIGVNDTSGAAATAVNAIALGPQSLAARDGAVAIGLAAAANGNVGDIALGSNSTTQLVVNTTGTNINGASYSFAGSNATSTVSIGSSTAPRTMTNLAAGRLAATSTDAINGSQLFSTNQAVEAVGNRVTKNEGDISSLQTGLATTNTNVTNLGNRVTTVDDRVTNLSQTIGSGAIGLVRQNGADAQLTVGAETGGTNVNMAGTSGNRTVSGVATGVVAATSTDAINGSQLFSTNQAVEAVGSKIDQVVNATNNTIQYDIDQRGTRRNSVTLQGGDVNNPVVLSNVAVGSKDTDAVNLSQMRDSSKDTLSSANEYTDARSQQIVSQVQTHVKGYVENASTGILDEAKKHTNDRFNLLSGEISGVRREAHQAAAIGLAAASLRFDDRPGKLSAAIGGGMWRGAGAAAFGLGYTSPDQQMRFNVSATTGGGDWGVGVGMSFTLN